MKFLVVREIQFNDKNQLSESIRMKGADVTVGISHLLPTLAHVKIKKKDLFHFLYEILSFGRKP